MNGRLLIEFFHTRSIYQNLTFRVMVPQYSVTSASSSHFAFYKVCITSTYIVLYIPYIQCKFKTNSNLLLSERSTGH